LREAIRRVFEIRQARILELDEILSTIMSWGSESLFVVVRQHEKLRPEEVKKEVKKWPEFRVEDSDNGCYVQCDSRTGGTHGVPNN